MYTPRVLLVVFLLAATALGIAPRHRADWALENAPAVLGVAALVLAHRRLRLSNLSYALILAFLLLHEVGAHYTYSEVPYRAWLGEWAGTGRNQYDRLVHFAYGLLLTYPLYELLAQAGAARGGWTGFLALVTTMAGSMLYELLEWAAALVFGEDLGQAYLGTQGDVWDAQKDMLCATVGAALSLRACALARRRP